MQAVFGLPGEVELFIFGFIAIKLGLIAMIVFVLARKLPALFRGFKRGASELQDSLNQGMKQ